MAIAEVRTHRLSAPLRAPFVTSLRRATTVESLVVEVRDAEGRSGYGEAPQVWRVTGESTAGGQACVREELGPRLLGRDPDDVVATCRDIRRAVVGNHSAKAAVDVALHDLAARRRGVPLVAFLGGSASSTPTDVTLSAGAADTLAAAARTRVAEGFVVLKMKVGAEASGELRRVAAVRDAVGPEVRIRLDGNQSWTPRQAVRIIRGIEDAGLDPELVEQPVAHWDLAGLAWVSERVDTPIMADEAVFGIRDLVEVIHRRAADMVNVKLAKCGGLEPARTLLDVAEAHGVGTIVGSMMESPIGVGAAASLAAAHGTTAVSDLDAAWWIESAAVVGGIRYEGGTVRLPDAAGLGVRGLVATTAGRAG